MGVGMGLGRKAEPAEIVADNRRHGGAVIIGPLAHRARNPVIAGAALEAVPALIDHHDDGVFVPRGDRLAVGVMAELGPFRDFADADQIGVHEVAQRLDVLRHLLGFGDGGFLRCGLALVRRYVFPVKMADGGI